MLPLTNRPWKLPVASVRKGPARCPRYPCCCPLASFSFPWMAFTALEHEQCTPWVLGMETPFQGSCSSLRPPHGSFHVPPAGWKVCPLGLPSLVSPRQTPQREALSGCVSPAYASHRREEPDSGASQPARGRLCLGPCVTSGKLMTSLCLRILVYKMLVIIVTVSEGCCDNGRRSSWKHPEPLLGP